MRQSKFHRDIPNTMNVIGTTTSPFPNCTVTVTPQKKNENDLDISIEDVVMWCIHSGQAEQWCFVPLTITVELKDSYGDLKCWGDSEQVNEYTYAIRVCTEQPLRDTVATLCHEMIHVKQWVTGIWDEPTYGEKECEEKQYEMADAFFRLRHP